jgi:CBS domain containing-hemolysin-like protein
LSGVEMLAILVPGLTLLLTAALEVASRSASRFELHRWARREADNGGDEDVDVTLIAVRLGRQLSLVALVVAVTAVGAPEQIGGASFAIRLAWSLGLALAAYLLVDKLAAFAVVAAFGPMRVLTVGRPLIQVLCLLLGGSARLLSRFQRDSRARDDLEETSPEEGDLDAFLDMAEKEGLVSQQDEALLRGLADFGEALVSEVMTPRVAIVSVPESATLRELSRLVAEHRVSRLPVVGDNIDQVTGIVNVRELVAGLETDGPEVSVRTIMRPPVFVPETKRVSELLREFQGRREQMAIVVDEYGGTAGLVTVEDLLEEIVGEIQDEHEDDELNVVPLSEGVVVAAGKAEVEEVEAQLGVKITEGDFETIGGMTFEHLGYVPKPGEEFERNGLHVEVLEADERRVHKVRITAIASARE